MLYASLAGTFLLPEEALTESPSRKAGISSELEAQLRLYGCELIQEAGCLLKLSQAVMATGQVLLHRFYCKRPLTKHDVKEVACASLFLACKLEEQQKRPRDVINVFHRLEQRRTGLTPEPLSLASERYNSAKKQLVNTERAMLRELGFILHVDHPHKTVLNYLSGAILNAEELMQEAWNLTNDSLRTTLCVQMRGEAIACGIIFMAARRLQVALPEDPPWWELFEVTRAELAKVCRVMTALYQQPKAVYVPLQQLSAGLASPAASPLLANGAPAQANGAARPAGAPGSSAGCPSPAEPRGQNSADRGSKRSRDSEADGHTSSPEGKRSRSQPEGHSLSGSSSRDSRDQEGSPGLTSQATRADSAQLRPRSARAEGGEDGDSLRSRHRDRHRDRDRHRGRHRDREQEQEREHEVDKGGYRASHRDRDRDRGRDRDRERDRDSSRHGRAGREDSRQPPRSHRHESARRGYSPEEALQRKPERSSHKSSDRAGARPPGHREPSSRAYEPSDSSRHRRAVSGTRARDSE